jgi:hypothetical protein
MNIFAIFKRWACPLKPKAKRELSHYQNTKKLELLVARFEAKKRGNNK